MYIIRQMRSAGGYLEFRLIKGGECFVAIVDSIGKVMVSYFSCPVDFIFSIIESNKYSNEILCNNREADCLYEFIDLNGEYPKIGSIKGLSEHERLIETLLNSVYLSIAV